MSDASPDKRYLVLMGSKGEGKSLLSVNLALGAKEMRSTPADERPFKARTGRNAGTVRDPQDPREHATTEDQNVVIKDEPGSSEQPADQAAEWVGVARDLQELDGKLATIGLVFNAQARVAANQSEMFEVLKALLGRITEDKTKIIAINTNVQPGNADAAREDLQTTLTDLEKVIGWVPKIFQIDSQPGDGDDAAWDQSEAVRGRILDFVRDAPVCSTEGRRIPKAQQVSAHDNLVAADRDNDAQEHDAQAAQPYPGRDPSEIEDKAELVADLTAQIRDKDTAIRGLQENEQTVTVCESSAEGNFNTGVAAHIPDGTDRGKLQLHKHHGSDVKANPPAIEGDHVVIKVRKTYPGAVVPLLQDVSAKVGATAPANATAENKAKVDKLEDQKNTKQDQVNKEERALAKLRKKDGRLQEEHRAGHHEKRDELAAQAAELREPTVPLGSKTDEEHKADMQDKVERLQQRL